MAKTFANRLAKAVAAGLLFFPVAIERAVAEPTELTVMTSVALASALDELAPLYEHASGNKVKISYSLVADFKKRIILVTDVVSGAVHPLHEDVEEQFWSVPGNSGSASQPSPDGRWIAFVSDIDGWDHLYVAPAAGGEPVQITTGKLEAWRPVWSHDGKKIAFDANEPDHPGV